MTLSVRLITLVMAITSVLLIPEMANAQDNTSLNGTTLTYYPRPTVSQCQADCANNANCKGFTWIQAGTYNRGDAAMCYLLSEVTGRASARGHFSGVKGSAGASLGAREDNTSLQGTTLTYYPRPNFSQCEADCANNNNCRGFTWIQAGTYNRDDAAMCYLLSEVTGRASARGHFSAAKETASGGAVPIDWSKGPQDHRGKNGQRFTYSCPGNGPTGGRLYGTDIYTDDSSVCTAAVHAGWITFASGGTVTIEIRPGQRSYTKSTRNGVTSSEWGTWDGSFIFVR